jgi:hypothetical protein
LNELNDWLLVAKTFKKDDFEFDPDCHEWTREIRLPSKPEIQTLSISKALFADDGRLLPMLPASWNPEWVKMEKIAKKATPPKKPTDDDEIPF